LIKELLVATKTHALSRSEDPQKQA
jgi:hypothetical protein